MTTSEDDPRHLARAVRFTDDHMSVDLADGRTITIPLEWYPRLLRASREQRDNWRLIGRGHGIHWPDVDEDVRTMALLEGKPSWEYLKTQAPAG